MLNTALENQAVMNWGDRYTGSADIDDKSRSFASSKPRTTSQTLWRMLRTSIAVKVDLRGQDAIPSKIESWSSPFFHCDFDGLFASFCGIPAALGHQ